MEDSYLRELDKKKNKAYARLEIKSIIDEWDPIGLLAMGAPNDEYSMEISAVAASFIRKSTEDELAKRIYDIFMEYFGAETFKESIKTCHEIAKKINARLLETVSDNKETDHITYSIAKIIDVDIDGITYLDNKKVKQKIVFSECRFNWVAQINEFRKKENKPELRLEESMCVAERDFFADKPYFEFFTEPHIRFEVDIKPRFWDVHKLFWKANEINCLETCKRKYEKPDGQHLIWDDDER